MNEKDLQKQYDDARVHAQGIMNRHNGKSTEMTATELKEWQDAIDKADAFKMQLDLFQKQKAHDEFAGRVEDKLDVADKKAQDKGQKVTAEQKALRSAILQGLGIGKEPTAEQTAMVKAYQADNPGGGGHLVVPQILAEEILTLMKDLCFVRQGATIFPLPTADSLGVAAFDTDPSDSDWTTELGTGSEETTAANGKRELRPHPMAKSLKMSRTLLRKALNAEQTFLDRLAYKAQVTEEKAFLTGHGASKPLGLFTASTQGISTGRDIAAASTSAITADEIINTFMNCKAQYRSKGVWVMHRDVVKMCRKFKDSANNYVWATGLGPGGGLQGNSQTLMGRPVCESEYAPNTFTTGLYMALFGDLSFYGIADALDMELQTLEELYAATNQRGFILRKETDGMPLMEEAFSRLILA